MTCHSGGPGALEYYPCRYGNSRVLFRGPRSQMEGDFIAFLGGIETYGRFIAKPYPELLERLLSVECVNFGVVNAGVDLYLNDPAALDLAGGASAKVLQVMGAQNLSNRFYMVHPRRNDRFLRASEQLETLYPEVDFTEFHFNRHMLVRLREVCETRYQDVVKELRNAWIARMKHILTIIRGKVVLLWFADHEVDGDGTSPNARDPLFVTRDMIETLRPRVAAVVEVVPSEEAVMQGTMGMVFNDFEACAAAELMGPAAHAEAADALAEVLGPMVGRGLA
ncbi:DUF6473 family protein [Tropicibacter oceani]|uniref:DUF6473 family protein n=1 Tax=Tropicibacter oceani TaxID=3058420 RepID=A0ABY8QMM8_9RHOB|nr:DUF6473 family protein [Tropicibacter oceani]WGW05800.1 DUF6473 family protein [Tropicibacter oceani]